jgi:mannose-6-phosphate isomerase-like protein (cupin superfamily)
MKAKIKKFKPESEYFFEEGCFITELFNSSEDEAVSVAKARVEPGKTTKWHRLDGITERYLILEGEARAEVEGIGIQDVGKGDMVLIPQLAKQRITNTGETDLVFLAICSPRFTESAYCQLED